VASFSRTYWNSNRILFAQYRIDTIFYQKKTPDFASTDEAFPGVQKWELTAGIGVAPKWVSIIGLLSISAIITEVVPWIVAFLKQLI
jgi:hypothetical protein